MKQVADIIPFFLSELIEFYPEKEIKSFAYLSMEHYLKMSKSQTIIGTKKQLSKEVVSQLELVISSLKAYKPIQYILGETTFYGLNFKINRHTLIPRPETEELVKWVLEEQFSTILDIGSGSGCISIAIAKNTNAIVLAIDISERAIEIAKENAKNNNVDIKFICTDILDSEILTNVDVIVSNPPYVLLSEKELMHKNVLDWEPSLALFVEDKSALIFYKKIAELAIKYLNPNGSLFFEINEKFGNKIVAFLKELGFANIELRKDINGKDRMIKARKK